MSCIEKPANVLLDEDFEPMLTDFGFSRFIDTTEAMTGETGSYRYMSPEMIRNETYNEKVDVYSFGIVINEIFARIPPFEHLLPIHAAVGVAKKGLRPSQRGIKNERLKMPVTQCWTQEAEKRPDWTYIIGELEAVQNASLKKAQNRGGIGKLTRKTVEAAL